MPKVLIIGAQGGLGRALAEVYGKAGFEIASLGREECDLSVPEAVARLAADRDFLEAGYDLCVFTAAISEGGYADVLDGDALRRCMEVNFLSEVTLFTALASAPSGCRRFVFVGSGAADVLLPGLLPYSLSKRALRDYLYVADMEKSFPDCYILMVSPGSMDTGFDRKAKLHGTYALPRGMPARPPQWVAKRIFEAERHGKARLNLAPLPTILGWFQRLAPRLTLPVIRRLSRLAR
jgi:NAD(P)-dependent dehydrogenase (short-subunit alcohol dehydrogenase family)